MVTKQFSVDINAPKEKVWSVLWDDKTFRDWINIIDEGTYMVGDLVEGKTVQFISGNSEGYGVTSLVYKLVPYELVVFRHLSDTQAAGTLPRDDEWSGSEESYTLDEYEGITTLTVVTGIPPELVEIIEDSQPRALARVKDLAEESL